MFRHGANVASHADGDDRTIDEFAIKVAGDQTGEQFALLVLVLVIDRNECTLDAEALDQSLFEICRISIIRTHADLDNAFLQRAAQHAPHGGAGDREHARQFFLR